ncbi:hypothetical protein JW905_11630 [bacterium]|nr:hypothetical protein [candidate division CSSED10-310 bacterium]
MALRCPWCRAYRVGKALHCNVCGLSLPFPPGDDPGPPPPPPPREIPRAFRRRSEFRLNTAWRGLPFTLPFLLFFGGLAMATGHWSIAILGFLPLLQQSYNVWRGHRDLQKEYYGVLADGASAVATIESMKSFADEYRETNTLDICLPGWAKRVRVPTGYVFGGENIIVCYSFTARGATHFSQWGMKPETALGLQPGHRIHVVYDPMAPDHNTPFPPRE